jgi:1-acyl-sn-glycerol-3-phosphate acyltransferase
MKPPIALRQTFLVFFFALNTAVLGILSILASLVSARAARKFARLWGKVEGQENLPDQDGFIVASNHASAADIGAVLAGLPADICWVAKASLLKTPFIGWHLKRVHIPIARRQSGAAAKLLEAGVKRILDGACVVIFPEGTRNKTGEGLLPFKKGAFILAEAAQRPIVPMAILGSRKVWGTGEKLPKPGKITLRLGSPIAPELIKEPRLENMTSQTRKAVIKLMEPEEQNPEAKN